MSSGGEGDPLQGAFQQAVEQVNELFAAAGIDISDSTSRRNVHAVWEKLTGDEEVEQLASKNSESALSKSHTMRRKVVEALFDIDSDQEQFSQMMQGSEDALDVFVKAMSHLAAAAMRDKENGVEPPASDLEVEERLRGLVTVLRENAAGSFAEEKLATRLDRALGGARNHQRVRGPPR